MLRGSTEILDTVCSHLGGLKPGETTKDGKFTVIEVECQGACSNAPMIVVNDDFYVSGLLSGASAAPIADRFVRYTTGGPYRNDDKGHSGCLLERLDTKTGSSVWAAHL